MLALTAGTMAPDFTLATMDGARFSLRDVLRRGPVVLAFFKIGCPVCQYAAPYLERLHQGYKGKNVTVVGVSQDSKQDTALFVKEFHITFPIALDDPANYRVSNAYGLTNVPTTFFVASTGEIAVSSVGWVKTEIAEINGKLAGVIPARPAPLFPPEEHVAEWRPG